MKPRSDTIIVIPAYNEQDNIGGVINVARCFGGVLVVDDGSSDNTSIIAKRAGANVLCLESNKGYDAALMAGLKEAVSIGAKFVVSLDGDGQIGHKCLENMVLQLWSGRSKLIIGERTKSARPSEKIFNIYVRWKYGVKDILCGLKGYHSDLLKNHDSIGCPNSVGTEVALLCLRDKVPFSCVDVVVKERAHGNSRFGGGIKPNLEILRALQRCLWKDLISINKRAAK